MNAGKRPLYESPPTPEEAISLGGRTITVIRS
ncbi:hypothetical protein NIES932_26910 [Raphidiopsis curvata NIES-932]|nr:hypothetical protein NIES932_26910 [Raphidiopsis curvata NIES-932]